MIKKQLLSTVVMLFTFIAMGNAQQINPVTSVEALKMIKPDKNWIVLDVRTPGEFNQGHIKGAKNIDIYSPDANEQYKKLDRDAKYLVICRTKNRSGAVANFMSQNGFKNIYQVTDGMSGWMANQLPMEK